MKIIVVGSGIAGSSLVNALEMRGVTPVHIGTAWAESMAALALLRRAYHKGDELRLFDRSLDLYRQWGVRVQTGAYVTNYRTPTKDRRWDEDWGVIDPFSPLRSPQRFAIAARIPEGVWVEGESVKADAVLWAGGAALNGQHITYGTTWIHDSVAAASSRCTRVHHVAPYKTLAVAPMPTGRGVRLGSSSAISDIVANEQAQKLLDIAADRNLITTRSGWRAVTGQRCKGSYSASEGIHHVFAGFHRTGYALVPALAEQFITERLGRHL
jgi:hypothetical protein